MKLGLVAAWKQITSEHKQLSDPKFKPPLAPLLAKYEADSGEVDDLKKQIDDLASSLIQFLKTAAAERGEIRDQIESARKQLVDQLGRDWNAFLSGYGDGADWDGVQKACKTYTTALKAAIPAIDDCVKQLTKSRDQSIKTDLTGIDQNLTKRKQVEDKYKKVADELDKLQDQIPQVVGSYIKIAQQMKDDDLADDINSIMKKFPVRA